MAKETILTPFQIAVLSFVAESSLSKLFYLTGGTALAEFYLHHRLSEDLDFFSQEEFKIAPVQSVIKKLMAFLRVYKMEYKNQLGLHTFFYIESRNAREMFLLIASKMVCCSGV